MCKIDKTKMPGFRNRLSTYLKDLGLQKKRYNDGYYYGIVPKDMYSNNYQSSRNGIVKRTIDDIEKERDELANEMREQNFFQWTKNS
jgi:hypothetical protein